MQDIFAFFPIAQGRACRFTSGDIAWQLGCNADHLEVVDEWLNDDELIELVILDGKIIGSSGRALTADEVTAYELRQWKGQK